MSQKLVGPRKPLPDWLIVLGSLVIAAHLLVVGVRALGAFSGPWPFDDGNSPANPPLFASELDDYTRPYYLRGLHMTHDYHFEANHPEIRDAYFEVLLRDKEGKTITTLKFPEDNASFWARHRQKLLAQALIFGLRVEPAQGELIPPPGVYQKPPNRPVCLPSDWSLVAARSYQRYLCREYHAASAQLICHIRNPVHPAYLFVSNLSADIFEELQCNFGEYRHEQ